MNIGVVGNISKESLSDAVETLLVLEPKYGLKIFFHDDLSSTLRRTLGDKISGKEFLSAPQLVKKSDIVIAIGGDGTILTAARIVGDMQIPILGINLGKLGFLAEASLDELEIFIKDIIEQKHYVEGRTVLRAVLENDDDPLFALNDIVVDKSTSTRIISTSVFVNGDYLVSFHGDGLIISTPTGSTGYALAAGGPIVVPSSDVFVIQPISAHSLNARTIVVPDTSVVRIAVENQSDEARVTADGQRHKIFSPQTNVVVQKGEYRIKLIKRTSRNYYDVLRAKLLLGRDIRFMKGKKE
jgi:NAD+ kinase